MNKKADSSTPIWIQAFGFLLFVLALFAIGNWGLNIIGTDDFDIMLQENVLENFIVEAKDFNSSDETSRSLTIYIPTNAVFVYNQADKNFVFSRPTDTPTATGSNYQAYLAFEGASFFYEYKGRNFPFPSKCQRGESCICMCLDSTSSSGAQIMCEQKVCKNTDLNFKSQYQLKEVFGEDYVLGEGSWNGGFLLLSNHKDISQQYSDFTNELTISSFGGIYLNRAQIDSSGRDSRVTITLQKEDDGKLSIKWGE
ncbi:MAG: hypothetical protein ACMXX7_01250 [Candidatus Woesearchaeota archaeon]